MSAARPSRRVQVLLLLLLVAGPLASAAPLPSVQGSGSQPSLLIDTRYNPQDEDTDTYQLTVRNDGNETLLGQGFASASGNGVRLTCNYGCGTYSLAPGQSRSVILTVHGDQGATDGTANVAYPVPFTNAPDTQVSVPVHVRHLEPGRLSLSVRTTIPELPCPGPEQVTVHGTVSLNNVGDETLHIAESDLEAPSTLRWSGTIPSQLEAGEAIERDFQFSIPANEAADRPTLTMRARSSSGWLEQEPTTQHTVRLDPPSNLQVSTGGPFSAEATYRPGVLGVLDPHVLTFTVEERCGYLDIDLDSIEANGTLHPQMPLPPLLAAGESADIPVTILIPLERLDTICNGYQERLVLTGTDESDRSLAVGVTVKAKVDLAQTRQRLQALGRDSIDQDDLNQAARGLSEAYLALMKGDACRGPGGISDVLAAAPPILWTWDLLSEGTDLQEDTLALAAMAPRLEDLCTGLRTEQARRPCLGFAKALEQHAQARLQAQVEDLGGAWSRTQDTSQQTDELRFLVAASALRGDHDAEQRWRERLEATQRHNNDLRAAAVRSLVAGHEANRRWLRDPTDARSQDYRHLEPVSFLLAESRHSFAVADLDAARRDALEAGDPVLAARIERARMDLESAHGDALAANLGVLGLWGAAALASVGFGTSRLLGWHDQRRHTRLGDVLS